MLLDGVCFCILFALDLQALEKIKLNIVLFFDVLVETINNAFMLVHDK